MERLLNFIFGKQNVLKPQICEPAKRLVSKEKSPFGGGSPQ